MDKRNSIPVSQEGLNHSPDRSLHGVNVKSQNYGFIQSERDFQYGLTQKEHHSTQKSNSYLPQVPYDSGQ